MTLLAGLWRFAEHPDRAELVRTTSTMLDAQAALGAASTFSSHPGTVNRVHAAGAAALGWTVASSPGGPADDAGTAGAVLLAVDARIDNRPELFAALGLRDDAAVADSDLIHLAYRRWSEAIVDHLLGDYAIAAWEPARQALTLIRDPTGQRPLHYRRREGTVAFASMPQGLFDVGEEQHLNPARLARFVADVSGTGPDTFFAGVMRVEPAQIVRLTRDGTTARRYWPMPAGEIRYAADADYIEAFREQLDRATRARLRGAGSVVAAHLSGGLDSGAVAATAARLLAPDGGRVLALTSAPRAGFAGPVPHGRVADESGLAAALAATYPTMEHLVLRSGAASPLDHLEEDARLFGQPVGFPCNNVWWRAANEAAQAHGIGVVLTGELGNLSISAGGLGVLADMIRAGQLARWARTVASLRREDGPRWRGLLASSFGPWVPGGLWRLLTRWSSDGEAAASAPLSRLPIPPEPVPARSDRERRWDLLRQVDPGNFRKGALLRWGVDERDPTSDRRLIEFCLSLPPSQLIGGGTTRRLGRAALADRVPAAILNGPRGYQYADWHEALDRDRLAAFFARIAASPLAAATIDLAAADRLIAAWPVADMASARTISTYRIGLLRALAAGAFALNAGR